MLTVRTIGTGTAFPQADRGPTCTHVRVDDRNVVVDLGSGSLQKLAAHGVTPISMDALLLTHAHLDHIADFFPMLFALHVPLYDRSTPLPVYASAETIAIVERVREAWGRWLDVDDGTFEWHPVSPGERFEVCGLRVDTGTVAHDPSSVGYRFHTPVSTFAIPGDSGPCDGLVALCEDVDLALLELSVPTMCPMPTHLDPHTLADVVKRSGMRKLAVVHRYPAAITNDALEELQSLVDIPVVAPDDGALFELG